MYVLISCILKASPIRSIERDALISGSTPNAKQALTPRCLVIHGSSDGSENPDAVTFLHVVLRNIVACRVGIGNTR